MTVRLVEGGIPYSAGTGISIDSNKVISLLLRDENNLIEVNDDNEIYTDLQLVKNIKPTDDFPVGVCVGSVTVNDGWQYSGIVLNYKTTSGDYGRWLYTGSKMYYDGNTGTWKEIYMAEKVDELFNALATVAHTGDYNDLINKPEFLQVQADWNQTDSSEPDYIKNKPTISTVNDGRLTIKKNGTTVGTFTANDSDNVDVNLVIPLIENSVTSTSTTTALSANMGKELQDEITNLQARGRYLAIWNATTGLPTTNPVDNPYTFNAGDYYVVGTTGTTNYKPSGTSYTWGVASTAVETEEVATDDVYYYDGANWGLQINHGKTVSFANLAGSPDDNANLQAVLDTKITKDVSDLTNYTLTSDLATVATTGSYNDLTNKPTIPSVPTNVSTFTNDAGYITKDVNNLTNYTLTTGLSTVATTGSYNDLSNKPTIPTVNNSTITIKQGTTEVGSFTTNQSSAQTLTIPNELPTSGTTGQVLTKTDTGSEWQDAADGSNVKAFTLSSTSDLTTAQAIYDYYTGGGIPIVDATGIIAYLRNLMVGYVTSSYFILGGGGMSNDVYSWRLKVSLSSGVVTSIATEVTSQVISDKGATGYTRISIASSLPSSPSSNTLYFLTS